jgi:NAD dependent epimerase/dehydratase family enzyme
MSWVHVDDVAGACLHALDGAELRGPINVVAGNHYQADFARTLGDVLKRPSWLPVPAVALRLAVGELAEYLLHGRRVQPAVLAQSGYLWKYPELAGALEASV